jgi:putative ABC transport system permease protein
MLTLRRAFMNIWRRRFRTVLVSLVLALCVAVFVSTIAGVDANEEATAEMLERYEEIAESTIEQTELSMTAITVQSMRGFMPQSESSDGMSEDVADDISDMEDVAAVVPEVSGGLGEAEEADGWGGPFGGGRVRSAYRVVGVPLDLDETYSVLPVNIVEGRSLEEDEDYAVLISEDLTDYFDAGVGDTIKIEGTYFDVVGVYSSGFMMNEVYMSLSYAQGVLDMEGEISSLTVYADSADDVDSVVAEIEDAYPDYMVMAMSDMQSQFGGRIQQQQEGIISTIDDNLSSIQSTGLGITVVSVIIGVLLIFGLMFYTVRERTKEIGTLKALGFSNRDVLKQFMYEGFYVGLIGGAVGLGIAAVSASLFSSLLLNTGETMGAPVSVTVTVTLQVMLLGLGVAAIAGAVGSLYPAWRASRVSPMEALRNE